MGIEPWTYARFETGRHHSLNDWKPKTGGGTDIRSVNHLGYRQPVLDRPVGAAFPYNVSDISGLSRATSKTVPVVDADGNPVVNDDGVPMVEVEVMNRLDPKTIRWPVNFEDLNWYLYQLPGNYQGVLVGSTGSQRMGLRGSSSAATGRRPFRSPSTTTTMSSSIAGFPSAHCREIGSMMRLRSVRRR